MATRREVLKNATLTAAAGATAAFAAPLVSASVSSTGQRTHVQKITLEEHFLIPEFIGYFSTTYPNISPQIARTGLAALLDVGDRRIAAMDENSIDFQVLSIAGPSVQVERDASLALTRCRMANDFLAREIQKRPRRYGGFAHLPMQSPSAAAGELERCVRDLGFQGAMINGQTNGEYLDLDKYSVFWERVQALEAPIYLHPGNPVDHPAMFGDHPELWGPVCSWAFETGAHALRLVFSGVFERYSGVTVVLGHMGETLPLNLWRFDSRWPISHRGSMSLAQPPSFYIRRNIAITTSEVCSDISLRCALDAMDSDKVMFSADYPFEKLQVASRFMEQARISESERSKVASENARRLMRIDRAMGTGVMGKT